MQSMAQRPIVQSALIAAVLGVVAYPANAADGELAFPIRPFVVFDADDNFVGPYYPPDFVQFTTEESERYGVKLMQSGGGNTLQFATIARWYTSSDCSGPAYVQVQDLSDSILPRAVMVNEGGEWQLAAISNKRETIDTGSFRTQGNCAQQVWARVQVRPLKALQRLVPPVKLPLHIK